MSLIVKVKESTLMVSNNPIYFCIGICTLITCLIFVLYELGYEIHLKSEPVNTQENTVSFDLLEQTEIDVIKPVVIGDEIIQQQWLLNDSVTELRKTNFESLFVISNEKIVINLDIPTSMMDKDVMDNLAYQAVNYAQILNKRAPKNNIKIMHLYMSEKIPMGKEIAMDFDYPELLKFKIESNENVKNILGTGNLSETEKASLSMIKVKNEWCEKYKEKIDLCN
jgi:hypothetical protein